MQKSKVVSKQAVLTGLLSMRQLAQELNCSYNHVQRLNLKNQLPCFRYGDLVRFDLKAVLQAGRK
jgi:excisionase family DNA binding protein